MLEKNNLHDDNEAPPLPQMQDPSSISEQHENNYDRKSLSQQNTYNRQHTPYMVKDTEEAKDEPLPKKKKNSKKLVAA